MIYSRKNPSPRYKELVTQYAQLHNEGETRLGIPAKKTFQGFSVLPHVDRIKRLVQSTNSYNLLDYGCGKGFQYQVPVVDLGLQDKEMLVDYWNVTAVRLYDACYEPHSILPEDTYDGVISTDMLEHCSEEDVPWIVDELFSFANKFVYANVACYPAKKTLPNGENAHCTIKDTTWWSELFKSVASKHKGIIWEVVLTYIEKKPDGKTALKELILSGDKLSGYI